jgi:malonate-semialdehyde dehydrogenase (acetylating)/methylmalonate-semialdehyde dehydrogenase
MSLPTEVEDTVQRAHAAFAGWRKAPIKERCQHLFRFRELMLENLDALSHRAAAEAGKTVAEARGGVMKGLEVVEFALSLQNLDQGAAMEVSRGVTCQMSREPLGVVCGIAPFNFPAMVPLWMFPIAVALGNCFILKPSEKVPLTAQMMGDLMVKAGFPDGVFSVVNGNADVVNNLIDHKHVQAVGFVGSTPVAKAVYTRATALGKRALALGGAKNHLLVVPDADPELTVRGVVDSFTGCAGQRCMAASLLVAVGDVEPLLEKITAAAQALAPGPGLGAIIDKPALDRIEGIIERAAKAGAKLTVDGRGKKPADAVYDKGTWLGPTVIDGVTPDMECAKTEIFGPVLTIVRVKTVSEAMALESHNHYGNATSVFTTSGAVARYVAQNATNGMVGVNIGVPVPREPFSFGGTKDSKFGQGDITGVSSLDFWTNLKKVTTKWAAEADHNWMS